MIIVSATPEHFWKARQELATLKQLAGLSKNTLARPAQYTGLTETMIKDRKSIDIEKPQSIFLRDPAIAPQEAHAIKTYWNLMLFMVIFIVIIIL